MRNFTIVSLLVLVFLLGAAPIVNSQEESTNKKPHPNIQTIQKYFEYYAKGDLAGIRSVMAEDVEWHIPGHHPLAGTKKGITELMAFFKLLQKADFKAEVYFLEASDKYVVDVHRGWGRYGPNALDQVWVLFYEFKDGKIWRVRNYAADQHEADLFFWRTYNLKPVQERIAE
ncbi:MAG: nuclear transport factor 2 family protein [Thermodesulfobacteriota bacterium]